ncbi:hypothetical protein A3E49_03670 [Candidatus Saccharibacteria bacterium RIFCSPHIGHO2_12_FULL_49_19]|nr:MAG: hypothetical protein A2708_02540 [Candidatus Saccharibacteria bacterium RIFCSPHIGHO2_01_FULL_49_21]OGL36239.1 MAG: hypothetical protein A3E49_03670 [Candidatus Saccharibacteria bacterium RIFCSPHIGHO2_12_FULL_49_19]OGL37340.1 MAG: hypothetical protein A3B63_02195 [Candidatus Saccharibacteria bacterium RIFCSPLOWO2_01_FULL_49_22]
MKPDEPPVDDNLSFMLPIPDRAQPSQPDPAAELVRQKVRRAYGQEPDAATEALDVAELGTPKSQHQEFIYNLTTSGRSLADIQTAWHEYYAGLPDKEKHMIWEEFYEAHARTSKFAAAAPSLAPKAGPMTLPEEPPIPRKEAKRPSAVAHSIGDLKDSLFGRSSDKSKVRVKPAQHFQSLLFGLAVGSVVLLIFLFGFFNERFIAPFIQPSRNVTSTPIISSSVASGSNSQVIIPKINVEIPVVYGVKTVDEASVNQALENGVVHYANTPLPGEVGNGVIVGHSSNNIFNKGKYKFAFVMLRRLENGDIFYLDRDGKRYTYEVYKREVVKPTDVSVLSARDEPATISLITCDPPGTTINRLVVVGRQINPDPNTNIAKDTSEELTSKVTTIPGNAPSLWSRLVNLLF